jgi:hypothetical protein
MSVYVDPLREVHPKANWPYRRACHLFADTAEELHEMAGLIGLSRSWFQSRPGFPHYDLTAYKRQQAGARGAIEVGREERAEFIERSRKIAK